MDLFSFWTTTTSTFRHYQHRRRQQQHLIVCQRTLFIMLLSMFNQFQQHYLVESATASEWSLGPAEEYVSAFINVTYQENRKTHTEKSEIGRFGSGKIGAANGLVVHVFGSNNRTDVHHGCDYPYGNQLPNEPWIALVKRGNCSFDKKLENAYRSNASALVVYAKEDSEQLEKMSIRACDICDIPSIMTFKWKGDEIGRKIDGGIPVYMYITVGETCTAPYSGINKTSVLFVSISFIVLMIISLCWLCFYYLQRFRYLHAKDRLAQRLCNAAKKALAKIPTRNVKLTDKELNGEVECCAVCIELYRTGDTLRTLPCRHEFHKGCVDPWLLEHRTCPMCKMDILKYYGFIQFTGSQESILHLDLDDAVLNSSESRETDSPVHETHQPQQQRHHNHHHHTTIAHVDEQPHSSSSSVFPERHRKASLISLVSSSKEVHETVVATPRAISYSRSVEPTSGENMGDTSSCKQSLSSSSIQALFPTVELNSLTSAEYKVSKSSLIGDNQSSNMSSCPEVESSSMNEFQNAVPTQKSASSTPEEGGHDGCKNHPLAFDRSINNASTSSSPDEDCPQPLFSFGGKQAKAAEPQNRSQQSRALSNSTSSMTT